VSYPPRTNVIFAYKALFDYSFGLDEIRKIIKEFDLFGIETHLISPNSYRLKAIRTRPK
jgi:hypothetical protein